MRPRAAALVVLVGCASAPASRPEPTSSALPPSSAAAPVVDVPDPSIEKVSVVLDRPTPDWKPPKDKCPTGVDALESVHVKIGERLDLGTGVTPVVAMGPPDTVDVLFDRARERITVVARKMGLVYVLHAGGSRCTLVAVTAGF